MKNNIFIIRLHMLILSPIFPSLLTFILLIVYKINFESVILCDNGSSPLLLEQLGEILREEKNIQTALNIQITDFKKSALGNSPSGKLTQKQVIYTNIMIDGWQELMTESLNRCKEIEDSMRRINPISLSSDRRIYINVLRALEENRRR